MDKLKFPICSLIVPYLPLHLGRKVQNIMYVQGLVEHSQDIEGDPFYLLTLDLAMAKEILHCLKLNKLQLAMAKEILHRLEIERDSRELSEDEDWLRKKLKLHCLGLAFLERTIARLRSRVLYLREGDANTAIFHQQARFRERK